MACCPFLRCHPERSRGIVRKQREQKGDSDFFKTHYPKPQNRLFSSLIKKAYIGCVMNTKDKIVDAVCFGLAPAILGGIILDYYVKDDAKNFFGILAIVLISFGFLYRRWQKEKNT